MRSSPVDSTLRLAQRTVLITGASGQIGSALTAACLAEGATVIATASRMERVAELAAAGDGPVLALQLDLGDEGSIAGLVAELSRRGLAPDGLVHCARDPKALENSQGVPVSENWHREYQIDVVGPYRLTMALEPMLRQSGRGAVVFVGSMYGSVAVNPTLYDDPAWAAPIHYACAKAAQGHLVRELAVRLAPEGIRVNGVAYGGVAGRMDASFQQRYAALCPQGRMLSMQDLGGPVVFLLDHRSAGVLGHMLAADGGWSIW